MSWDSIDLTVNCCISFKKDKTSAPQIFPTHILSEIGKNVDFTHIFETITNYAEDNGLDSQAIDTLLSIAPEDDTESREEILSHINPAVILEVVHAHGFTTAEEMWNVLIERSGIEKDTYENSEDFVAMVILQALYECTVRYIASAQGEV